MAHLSDANVAASVPAELYPHGGRESMDAMLSEADDRAEYEAWLDANEAEYWDEDYPEDNMSDVEADADTLASAGYGTDEDYGDYGGEEWDWE